MSAGGGEGRREPGRGGRPRAGAPAASGAREVVVARYAGYCYGVERALRLTDAALGRAGGRVATLGPLIHNPGVVARLRERGVEVVASVDDLPAGTLVLRTHGVPPEVVARAREGGLDVVDATCPFVAVAQRRAAELRAAGYQVVILGEPDHPEVVSLQAVAGEGATVAADAAALPLADLRGRRVGVVVQTTQTRANLAAVAAALAPVARELLVANTICDATARRQRAAVELAEAVDAVVVVGGRDSANTARLAQLCRERQPRTWHVESAAELDPTWFAGARRIGVTAGASTPDDEIEAVVAALRALPE